MNSLSVSACVLSVVAFSAVLPASAQCTTPQKIPIYSTGKQDITLPDPHWWLVQTPTAVGPLWAYVTDNTGFPFPQWVVNDANSAWISPLPSYRSGGTDAEGLYIYATRFDLTGFNPATVSITFQVAVDNNVQSALINNLDTGLNFFGDGISTLSIPRTISTGFRSGINYLTFVTGNLGGAVGNPSGFRMSVVSATGCPQGTLTVTPVTGPVGMQVSLAGAGFAAGEDVIYYGGTPSGSVRQLGTAVADASGNVSGTVRIPATPLGAYNIEALGQTSETTAWAVFSATPRLVINPGTGRIGDTINIQAYGFAAGETVYILWNNPRIPLLSTVMDATGSSALLTFVIPSGPALGTNLIVAKGKSSLAIESVPIILH